jgi:hypothetical protein
MRIDCASYNQLKYQEYFEQKVGELLYNDITEDNFSYERAVNFFKDIITNDFENYSKKEVSDALDYISGFMFTTYSEQGIFDNSEDELNMLLPGEFSTNVVELLDQEEVVLTEPLGQKIEEGVYVNQEGLTKEEQLELFYMLEPSLKKQLAKTNKGPKANKMMGLGLRWDYKSNNRTNPIDVGQNIRGMNTSYGYFTTDIKGNPLTPIPQRLRELLTKATGVDISDYDGAIINLYDENTFIGPHADEDESITAIKYPVVAVNIGGNGVFVVGDNTNYQTLDLKDGAGYVFGYNGKNRTVRHSTTARSVKGGFLPTITTEIDGQTYPQGSYRITITMRKVRPLTSDMPVAPVLSKTPTKVQPQQEEVTTQTQSTTLTQTQIDDIRRLEIERDKKIAEIENSTPKHIFSYNGVNIDTDFPLSVDQSKALRTLIDFTINPKSESDRSILLQGAGGTGKTSIIGYLEKYLKAYYRNNDLVILYSAPTHAATVELAMNTMKTGNKQLPTTVKSMIKSTDNGYDLSFKASQIMKKNRVGAVQLIVVDEVSMLDNSDYEKLKDLKSLGYKIIFMGDKHQLPEVDPKNPNTKSVSKAFVEHTGDKALNLDKIHRTSNAGIKAILQKIRDSVTFQLYKLKENTKNITFFDRTKDFDDALKQKTLEAPEDTVYIAYTNHMVSTTNKDIREKIFGRKGNVQKGDILMGYVSYGTKQIEKGDLANSVSYTVTDVEQYRGQLSGFEIKLSSNKLETLRKEGFAIPNSKTTYIPLSSNESLTSEGFTQEDYDKNNKYLSGLFEDLANAYRRYKQDGKAYYSRYKAEQQTLGDKYLRQYDLGDSYIYDIDNKVLVKINSARGIALKDSYGSLAKDFTIEKGIDYGHAITIHKAQGKTIKNVFFDASTIPTDRDAILTENEKQITTERQAMAYVGMSRASENLYVNKGSFNYIELDVPIETPTEVIEPLDLRSERIQLVRDNYAKLIEGVKNNKPIQSVPQTIVNTNKYTIQSTLEIKDGVIQVVEPIINTSNVNSENIESLYKKYLNKTGNFDTDVNTLFSHIKNIVGNDLQLFKLFIATINDMDKTSFDYANKRYVVGNTVNNISSWGSGASITQDKNEILAQIFKGETLNQAQQLMTDEQWYDLAQLALENTENRLETLNLLKELC